MYVQAVVIIPPICLLVITSSLGDTVELENNRPTVRDTQLLNLLKRFDTPVVAEDVSLGIVLILLPLEPPIILPIDPPPIMLPIILAMEPEPPELQVFPPVIPLIRVAMPALLTTYFSVVPKRGRIST